MKFLEKDLEEIIFNTDRDILFKRNLSVERKLKRQLRIGNYGIADLVGYEKPLFYDNILCERGLINVYELKQDNISVSAFFQALRYLKGIQQFISKRDGYNDYRYGITLIGRSIDLESSLVFLPDVVSSDDFYISLYTYSYDVDGITFKEHENYCLTKEGF